MGGRRKSPADDQRGVAYPPSCIAMIDLISAQAKLAEKIALPWWRYRHHATQESSRAGLAPGPTKSGGINLNFSAQFLG